MKTRYSCLLIVLFLSVSRGKAEEPTRYEYEEPHMGTKFRVVLYAQERERADQAAKAVFKRVSDLNQIMSDYLADSELSVLCRKNSTTLAGPLPVSNDLFHVMKQAQEISQLSEGAFDITIGPIVRLWRAARKDRRLPDSELLQETLMKVGYTKYRLDSEKQTVELLVPGMLLDLGGIAKGYAADSCLNLLKKFGINRALVAASGDIAVGDPPPGQAHWRVEVGALPGMKEKRILLLKNAAVSTSGDAEQHVEIAGVRYSHIVNPKTGLGLTGRRSITVIASKGILADSLTKMASILPTEKALSALEKLPGTSALIIVRDNNKETIEKSRNFDSFLEKR